MELGWVGLGPQGTGSRGLTISVEVPTVSWKKRAGSQREDMEDNRNGPPLCLVLPGGPACLNTNLNEPVLGLWC